MIELLGNSKFSRWLAPLIGLIAGASLAIKQLLRERDQDFTFAIIVAGLGLLSGIIILFADQSESEREQQLAKSPQQDPEFRTVARALALIALIASIFPFVGIVISLGALAANIRYPGWPRIVSSIALVVSISIFLIIIGH